MPVPAERHSRVELDAGLYRPRVRGRRDRAAGARCA
jgi:hypothetical protein